MFAGFFSLNNFVMSHLSMLCCIINLLILRLEFNFNNEMLIILRFSIKMCLFLSPCITVKCGYHSTFLISLKFHVKRNRQLFGQFTFIPNWSSFFAISVYNGHLPTYKRIKSKRFFVLFFVTIN